MLGNLLVVLFISTIQYIKNCYSCHDISIKSFQNSFPVKLVIILIFIFNHHFSQRLWRIVTLKFKELMRYFQVISAITILKHFMPEYNHFFDQRLSSNNHQLWNKHSFTNISCNRTHFFKFNKKAKYQDESGKIMQIFRINYKSYVYNKEKQLHENFSGQIFNWSFTWL